MGAWHVEEQVRRGEVIPVLADNWGTSKPVWIYYSSRDNLPKRTRLFIDFLVEHIKQ
ncbi:hypothetical protein QW180_26670 [Vibrio sinaloensis]|nr:hypothetical protein [Vibrio sinaloensis]